jgi:D-serine dehydratase
MSYIDNEVRATKASNILALATNVHLDLNEQINRLYETDTFRPLFAAYKALTGETFSLGLSSHLMPAKLRKTFFHKLDITGNSYEEKVDQLNAFGYSHQDQS